MATRPCWRSERLHRACLAVRGQWRSRSVLYDVAEVRGELRTAVAFRSVQDVSKCYCIAFVRISLEPEVSGVLRIYEKSRAGDLSDGFFLSLAFASCPMLCLFLFFF